MVDAPQGTDAGADAAVDSPPSVTTYDVVYVNEFTLTPNTPSLMGFLLIVNRGTAPLSLETATVVTFSDDNAGIEWTFQKESSSVTMLAPGTAAGLLSPAAAAQISASGLVTEPIANDPLSFGFSFPSPPAAGTTFKAQAVIQVGAADAVLPFTIHVVASGSTLFNNSMRVSSQ